MTKWHTEKPKKSGKYIVTVSDKIVTTREYNAKRAKWLPLWCDDILAWAKLPKPFKEKKNDI